MITSKKELKLYLYADKVMKYGGEKSKFINLFISDSIDKYLISMRYTAYYKNCVGWTKFINPLFVYHYIRFKRYGIKLGFSIGCNSLGYGTFIPHYGTIVVNTEARVGNYSVLHTSTCIAGAGYVGDGLYMSTGAIILYPKLGDYVSVSANSYVTPKICDVSNVLLVGSPAFVKKDKYPKWYERDNWTYKVEIIEQYKHKIGL